MYCVIQEIELKNPGSNAERKKIETYRATSRNGLYSYCYRFSGEGFERPVKKAYKISIHHSYREDGKVKKKQWHICTMSYYDIADGYTWVQDKMRLSRWEELISNIGVTEDEFVKIIYDKLDPLIEKIEKEFQQTEEYKAKMEHEEILKKYRESKYEFKKKWGSDNYECYFDVFGVLREPEMFEAFKKQYKASKEYERSYYENFKSNYNNYSKGSYSVNNSSNYKEEDKEKYKKVYKVLAKAFHPDIVKDDGEMMKFVNNLKDEWGL